MGRRPAAVMGALAVATVLAACAQRAALDTTAPDPAPAAVQPAGRGPTMGDHWHAAFGINVCGTWLADLDGFDSAIGIHTHGDGVIHIHPFSRSGEGERATLGLFLDETDVVVGPGSLVAGGDRSADGDECDGEPGIVQIAWWADARDDEPLLLGADPAAVRLLSDGEAITVAFLPRGADIPKPPTVGHLAVVSPSLGERS